MRKKLLSTMLALCIVLTMLPMGVLATGEVPETSESTSIEPETEEPQTQEDVPTDNVPAPIVEPEETVETQDGDLDSKNEELITSLETENTTKTLTPGLESPISGTCGTNLTWSLDLVTGVLNINGSGEMTDYVYSTDTPWSVPNIQSNIRSIILQEGVTSIGDRAFSSCTQLVKVVFPNSIESIGKAAFAACVNLTDMTIPDAVTTIGTNAFNGCKNLVGKIILKNTTNIGSGAFEDCKGITAIEIHGDIGSTAFMGCTSLKTANIIDATRIGSYAFAYCSNLTKINIPDSVTEISGAVFAECGSLKSIIIPDSVTGYLSYAMFDGCSKLESVILSKNVILATAQPDRFLRCTNLKYIFIPKGVRELSWQDFRGCNNLTDIYFEGNEDNWKNINVSLSLKNITIHYNSKPEDVPMPPEDDIEDKTYVTFYQSDVPSKSLEVDWNWDLFNGISSHYNSSLSAIALTLSAAVENSQEAAETELKNLGFTTIESKNYAGDGVFQPGVTFGHKVAIIAGEAQHIFAIVVRGTKPNSLDGVTDVVAFFDQFSTTAISIKAQFNRFVEKICYLNMDRIKTNSKFLITGHSLGGAVANLVTEDLNKIYKEENIFAYTFATPNTTTVINRFLSFSSNRNIINIINNDDPVPILPPYNAITKLPLMRFGQDWKISKSDFTNPISILGLTKDIKYFLVIINNKINVKAIFLISIFFDKLFIINLFS